MSRALYTTLLFVMTAIGFGEFRGSLSDQINTAKAKTIEANRASDGAKQAVELADWKENLKKKLEVRTPTAVLGVRG